MVATGCGRLGAGGEGAAYSGLTTARGPAGGPRRRWRWVVEVAGDVLRLVQLRHHRAGTAARSGGRSRRARARSGCSRTTARATRCTILRWRTRRTLSSMSRHLASSSRCGNGELSDAPRRSCSLILICACSSEMISDTFGGAFTGGCSTSSEGRIAPAIATAITVVIAPTSSFSVFAISSTDPHRDARARWRRGGGGHGGAEAEARGGGGGGGGGAVAARHHASPAADPSRRRSSSAPCRRPPAARGPSGCSRSSSTCCAVAASMSVP